MNDQTSVAQGGSLQLSCDGDTARCAELAVLSGYLRQQGYRHTTVTPASHERVLARGPRWARNLVDVFGWSRPFRAALLAPELFAQLMRCELLQPEQDGWRCTVRLSTLGERYFLHSAYPTARDDAVFFGPDTYRFVRALEAEVAPWRQRPLRVADIGCGAGVAAIVLAGRWPAASVLALDINLAALQLTRVNALLAGAGNVAVHQSDLLDGVAGKFDLIVSNPPYLLDPDQRAYRHGGGELGAGLSVAIVECAIERLAPGGSLLLYTGVAMPELEPHDPFLGRIMAPLRDAGFSWRYGEIDPDVFGEELCAPAYRQVARIAAVWLVATKPG